MVAILCFISFLVHGLVRLVTPMSKKVWQLLHYFTAQQQLQYPVKKKQSLSTTPLFSCKSPSIPYINSKSVAFLVSIIWENKEKSNLEQSVLNQNGQEIVCSISFGDDGICSYESGNVCSWY